VAFLIGFVGATLVGLLSTFLVGSWITINQALGRINSPPQPALRAIPGGNIRGIGTDPAEAPMQVLNQSCLTILVQLLLQIVVFVLIVVIIISLSSRTLQQELPLEALYGIFFAAALGILTSAIWGNWTAIRNSYNSMVNPPAPSLPGADSQNSHYVAARPPLSPRQVVVDGCFEIILRAILQIGLLGLLVFTILGMILYLSR
jgi:hypothetical protein